MNKTPNKNRIYYGGEEIPHKEYLKKLLLTAIKNKDKKFSPLKTSGVQVNSLTQ